MNALSKDKMAQWKFDGFLSPFPLLDADELQSCQAGVQRFESWLGSPVNAHPDMKWRSMPHLLLPWAANLARNPRILDHVEDLIGPDILIFTSTSSRSRIRRPSPHGTRTPPTTAWSPRKK